MSEPALTPMMAQYQAMRRSLPADIILFYRLGDFYEMFFDDAKAASPIMNVALTKRGGTPMCGVPFHAAQGYIARLLKAGKRVAIAEQTSEPVAGKLGSIDDEALLDNQRPNYLAAVCRHGKSAGLACIDHTTGEFTIAEFADLVLIDAASQWNLDLVDARSGKAHTLLGVLNRTATPEYDPHFSRYFGTSPNWLPVPPLASPTRFRTCSISHTTINIQR
jgi:DNA mismatch repair ATPase MutS